MSWGEQRSGMSERQLASMRGSMATQQLLRTSGYKCLECGVRCASQVELNWHVAEKHAQKPVTKHD